MSERGAKPRVPQLQQRVLRAAESFFTPLLPDDYLELINPLWTTREVRGRVEQIKRETEDAVTILIKPGWEWPGHKPGQYVRIGVVVDGVHHWRAYSLTSDPDREDGMISITPKLVEEGAVSPYWVKECRPGVIVKLSDVEGVFTLPDPPPEKLLFISAGSGITPIMSMLRHLDHEGRLDDAMLIHSARNEDDIIFGRQLKDMEERNDGFRVHRQMTSTAGRFEVPHLEELCPDWKDREAFCSGPAELLDTLEEHWERHGDCDKFHLERFQPVIGGDGEGEGGTIKFLKSDQEVETDGSQPILVAGEEAGLELPFGCRMGICHTCTGKLVSGRLRDLRSGEVDQCEGEMVRTCIHAPEGPVEIEL
jgi:stearoyl-CoA 9-desaturase NADPH oxidoreductase